MATILIAGGAGFIGSHLTKRLLKERHTVLCVDNLITGSKKNIEALTENPNFTFVEHDITKSLSAIGDELSAVDYIFHLASPASPNKNSPRSYIAYPIETLRANSFGTYNLLELAQEKGSKFLFASTSEIYGDPAESPQKETYFGNVNPNGIRSVYDESKRFGETATSAFLRKFGTDVRIARLFNTYGPFMQHDDGRVVSNFINQALKNEKITIYGDGSQTRSFCYIDDMIEALCRVMFYEETKGQVMNLGNPDERTITEIAEVVKKITGSSSEITHEMLPEDDPRIRKPDIQKAKSLLSWEPVIGLEEGLEKTVAYFKQDI